MDKHNEAIVGLVRVSRALIDNQRAHEDQMIGLRTETQRQMNELRTEMLELAKSHRETDERLSAFITFVERYIGGRNGGERRP